MRVFLDANSLFSAAKSNGAVRAFLTGLKDDGHKLVADGYVMDEARRNLEIRFPGAMRDWESVLADVEASAKTSGSPGRRLALDLPEKDWPVLAAAIQLRCHVLFTGDKSHFGSLYGQTIEGVEIHWPASLAEKLGKR